MGFSLKRALGGLAKGVIKNVVPGGSAALDVVDVVKGGGDGGGGSGGGSTVGNLIEQLGGPAGLISLGLGGVSAVQGAQQTGQSNELLKQLADEEAARNAQQGQLRDQFLSNLGQPAATAPDLSNLFRSDNPFAQNPYSAAPTPEVTQAAPQTPQPTGIPAVTPTQAAITPGSGASLMDLLGRVNETSPAAAQQIAQTERLAPDTRPDEVLNAVQLLARRKTRSRLGSLLGAPRSEMAN